MAKMKNLHPDNPILRLCQQIGKPVYWLVQESRIAQGTVYRYVHTPSWPPFADVQTLERMAKAAGKELFIEFRDPTPANNGGE